MNRLVLAALTVAVAGSAAASAQQKITLPDPQIQTSQIEEAPSASPAVSAETHGFIWSSQHYHRYRFADDGTFLGDSNRITLQMPVSYGNVSLRGIGEIFAPKYFYSFFNSSVYNDNTRLAEGFYYTAESADTTDQDYINQFKDAGAFRIDAITTGVYENPKNTETATQAPAGFAIYKLRQDLSGSAYRTNGVNVSPDTLIVADEREITPEEIDATIKDGFIQRSIFEYDPPIEFANGESAILMYQNLEGAPIPNTSIDSNSTDEFQNLRGVLETRPGGTSTLTNYKSFGVLLLQEAGKYSIVNAYRVLTFGTGANAIAAIADFDYIVFGSVDLAAGVRYHFGSEVGGQGVNAVSPNPVSADTRVPFTLTERSHVTLDLFATGGQHIRTLVNETYVPGNYSAPLAIGDLQNGVYLVRMIAGTKVYTQKLIVNR